jgi:hypothetical protein
VVQDHHGSALSIAAIEAKGYAGNLDRGADFYGDHGCGEHVNDDVGGGEEERLR